MSNDNNQPTTLRDLKELVRMCVRDEAEYLRERQYPEDGLHEIADSCVPIYYHELAETLASDPNLGWGPEDLHVEGSNVWQILSAAIYEQLRQTAHEAWQQIQNEPESVPA